MKAIQKNQGDGWQYMSVGYTGLNEDEARAEIKKLRKEAKEEGWDIKYRLINVVLVPQ